MTGPVRWIRRALAGCSLAVVLGLAACGSPARPVPGPTTEADAAPATGTPTAAGRVPSGAGPNDPAPEPSISYAPGAGPPSGARSGGAPEPTPVRPGEPAATAAGPLDEAALPRTIAGYTGTPGRPAEGEYNPNGTWVHATDPAAASFQALPMCGNPTDTPAAAYALAGTYAGPGGTGGNGLVLQFGNAQEARDWYAAFVDRLAACPAADAPETVTDLTRADGWFTARRQISSDRATWSEAGRVKHDRVLLVALSGTPELRRLGDELRRF